jgi:biotin-dependent carboxylase-like uncharacterized protein
VSGLEVLAAGPATTVQDLGRPGFGAYGVPEGGAMDRGLFATANHRAGNTASTPTLEFVLNGPRLRWTGRRRLRCVVAGDAISEVTLAPGDEVVAGALRNRAYGYLAVNGGFDVPVVMGARGTCLPGGFGGFQGRELRSGDVLPVGQGTGVVRASARTMDQAGPRTAEKAGVGAAGGGQLVALTVLPGNRAAARGQAFLSLLSAEWVAGDGNRVGIRLHGPTLSQRQPHLSQPIPPGAIQVTGAGQPILLLRDHPTVGGYPVVAVVLNEDLDAAAQLRPGTRVRFVSG